MKIEPTAQQVSGVYLLFWKHFMAKFANSPFFSFIYKIFENVSIFSILKGSISIKLLKKSKDKSKSKKL